MGSGNSNSNSLFWKRLQFILEKNGYNDVEIVAAGTCGLGSIDEVELILKDKEYIDKIDLDLIIIGYLYNDNEINDFDYDPHTYLFEFSLYEKENMNSFFNKFIKKSYPNLYNKKVSYINNKYLYSDFYDKDFVDKYGCSVNYWYTYVLSNEYKKLYENNFVKYISEYDKKIMIYNLNFVGETKEQIEFGNYSIDMFRKYNINFYENKIEFSKLFDIYEPNDLMVSVDDYHPSEVLNDFYANNIFNILKKDYKEVIGKKTNVKDFELLIDDYLPYEVSLKKTGNNQYEFYYPERFLKSFTGEEYIKLNLKYPFYINNIEFIGDNIDKTKIWINEYNDSKNFQLLKGNIKYNLNKKYNVFSLNINIKLKDIKNNKITMIIE